MENPIFKTALHNGQRGGRARETSRHMTKVLSRNGIFNFAPLIGWRKKGERGGNRETRAEAGGGPISLLGFLVTLFSAEVSASTFMGPQDYCGVECDVKCDRVLQQNW